MPEPIPCSIPGCDRPKLNRGWCRAHYLRWYKYGDPLAGRGAVVPADVGTCSVDGCDHVRATQGFCGAHYQRWLKHGSPGTKPIEVKRPGATCSMDGCDRKHYAKDLCQMHWQRFYKHGDPAFAIPARWQGDDVRYNAVHKRLNRSRGKADTHPCAHCGQPAKDWAYDHNDPDEKYERRSGGWVLAYSVDPDRYMPLCGPCHSRFDHNVEAAPLT